MFAFQTFLLLHLKFSKYLESSESLPITITMTGLDLSALNGSIFCFEWFFLLRINLFVCIEMTMCITFDKIQKSYKFSKTGAFKSLENPSIQTWIWTLLSRKIPDIELQKKGIAGENWFSSRRENLDCSFGIGHNHISSWENKILLCPARVCWKNLLFTKPWQYHDMWYNISLR